MVTEKKIIEARDGEVTFKAGLDGVPGKELVIIGYLFNARGELLASSPAKDGQVRFSVPESQLKRARVFFGPQLPERKKTDRITVHRMERLMAYEAVWKYEAGKKLYEVLPITEVHWSWWLWCRCRVKGKVLKRVYSGGVTYEAPVCGARVHICEVDRLPRFIIRLPDDAIMRLRYELLKVLERPPRPIPDPPPDPWIEVGPEMSRQVRLSQLKQTVAGGRLEWVGINPQPEPPGEALLARPVAKNRIKSSIGSDIDKLGPQPEPPDSPMSALSLDLRMALESNAVPVVRKVLYEHIELIRPWICWWEWLWPYFYDCDEVGVAITDGHGNFADDIWYLCAGDHPDLYFWVEYSIGGVWETVYKPKIRCHTHWNYSCGSEVTIRLTDPRVPGCGEVPIVYGKKVVVKSIGRQVSMGEIYQEADGATVDGTVKEGWLHATKNSPFGSILQPRVDFGNGLKEEGITHYRWSYRELGSTDDDDWKVIDAPVSRHYREATGPGEPPVYKSLQIGPGQDVKEYYVEIDPALPANGEDWEILDERYDLSSAHFDTRGLTPGKYEMKLELFKKIGTSMQAVDFDTAGVELYEISANAPFTMEEIVSAVPSTKRKLMKSVGGGMHLCGYRLVVHVDNRVCFGTINSVTVTPGETDTKCGFLEYGPGASATISFRASHPNNFAWFDFDVVRVSTALPSASATGLVETGVNGFSKAGDTFSKELLVGTILKEGLPADEIPCVRAAFAESLWVYALATDGYERLHFLDAPRSEDPLQIRLRGFALAPQEE